MTKRIIKTLVVIIITLLVLIINKKNPKVKEIIYKNILDNNINFAYINKKYKKYFGNDLPFSDKIDVKTVFNEKIEYLDKERIEEGLKLTVSDDYIVPSIGDGLVIYIGDKENYKNVVIVEMEDGANIWYANMDNINVKLYDYIKKGSLIGDCHNELYILNKRNGEFIIDENLV